MTIKQLLDLKQERQQAMARARWCKANGVDGFVSDVVLARSIQRMLLRAMRGAS